MKKICLIGKLLFCFVFSSLAQDKKASVSSPDPAKKVNIVEASCGQCNFSLKGKGCDLAVRINGKAYYVKGTGINDHGDAHDDDGFCNSIRKAEVQGDVEKGKYVVTYFKLLPKNGKPD